MHYFKFVFCVYLIEFTMHLTECQIYPDSKNRDAHNCRRECKVNENPKICNYKIKVETYSTMGPACGNCPRNLTDCLQEQCIVGCGVQKFIISLNRRYPGPAVEVCEGDIIRMKFTNAMPSISVTTHFHGIRQKETPWMDGPLTSQCPIHPGSSFLYEFKADKAGTYFYHAHGGLAKQDGFIGRLIIRLPKSRDPNGAYYDYELDKHCFITDAYAEVPLIVRVPGTDEFPPTLPDQLLLNGKGFFSKEELNRPPNQTEMVNAPGGLERFVVRAGFTYRHRVVFAVCSACAVRFRIDQHQLTVITTDSGNPVKPVRVESICGSAAERFDFTFVANQPVASYFIYIEGLGSCSFMKQYAVLEYEGARNKYPTATSIPPVSTRPRSSLNKPGDPCNSTSTGLCVSQLESSVWEEPTDYTKQGFLQTHFSFLVLNKKTLFTGNHFESYFAPAGAAIQLRPMINNISFEIPPSPMLTDYCSIPNDYFCPRDCYEFKSPEKCTCLSLYKFALNTLIKIIIIVDGEFNDGAIPLLHPIHIHGLNFRVLETKRLPKTGAERDTFIHSLSERVKADRSDLSRRPIKDTIGVATGMYAVIVIYADNPGFWPYHCHIQVHQDHGMMTILQVGKIDEMVSPPCGFPKCGDYCGSLGMHDRGYHHTPPAGCDDDDEGYDCHMPISCSWHFNRTGTGVDPNFDHCTRDKMHCDLRRPPTYPKSNRYIPLL